MKERKPLQRVLLVGGGAREHAIGEALCRNGNVQLLVAAHNLNPGLLRLATDFEKCEETDVNRITNWSRDRHIDWAIIGLEDPLAVGLPDALLENGIPTVGPCIKAAQLEISKKFTRELMERYSIPGRVEYRYFSEASDLRKFLNTSGKEFALKPVGLTAGKGVKVIGVQLNSVEDAIRYGEEVISKRIGGTSGVIVEERLVGEEFTLQTFVDGKIVVPMPLVKDYKLAFEGDKGPNTGSMGSYSQADGLLPFVREEEFKQAVNVVKQIIEALRSEHITYQGVLYGQFMKTKQGIKLIEINARFGDPEAINVLPLLQNDFKDVCIAIVNGTLQDLYIRFAKKATVCKYITPRGYGLQPVAGVPLSLDMARIESLGVKVFFAKVEEQNGKFLTTTSRSIALLGIGDSIEEAEVSVEKALPFVHGDYHVRHDIGKGQFSQNSSVKEFEAAIRL